METLKHSVDPTFLSTLHVMIRRAPPAGTLSRSCITVCSSCTSATKPELQTPILNDTSYTHQKYFQYSQELCYRSTNRLLSILVLRSVLFLSTRTSLLLLKLKKSSLLRWRSTTWVYFSLVSHSLRLQSLTSSKMERL